MIADRSQPLDPHMQNRPDITLRRSPELGSTDLDSACAIIDAARICHVGFALDGQPYVVPMACARRDRQLLLHGSVASRLMKHLAKGMPVCVTVTHLDGLVLARSSFHSSMNYRSVMVFGSATPVTDPEDKSQGLDVLVEHLFPGRLAELRPSTRKELNATLLLALPLEVFTVKVSDGPPDDPRVDLDEKVWAGVVPMHTVFGEPEEAPDMRFEMPVPSYLASW